MAKAARRIAAARHRVEAAQARADTRSWVVQRRERTHLLIELGGLVAKAGLVDLAQDDRAALYGAFLELAERLQAPDGDGARLLWRRRGQRAFARDAEPVE